ncbi:MAG: tandem-95 repeat protein, partial [Trichodesmium erythraeum GBRTRLIN201]|nr:tandem-95 repeat protein [Trichodesmium erythraeum GBRTRLIN201]
PEPTPDPTPDPEPTPDPTPDPEPEPIPPDPGDITPPDLNEPPTDILLDRNSVPENSEAGTVIGTFTTEDLDVDDSHEYRLIDNADGRFALDQKNNQLVVGEGANLDFEKQESFDIRVRTFDSAAEIFTKSFTISLTNVNDPPEIIVAEEQQPVNEGEQLEIVGIEVTDPDVGEEEVEVTLETTNSTTSQSNLTLDSNSSITFTTGDGEADSRMVFKGTLENINESIKTLTYTGKKSGSDFISITVNDEGNTGEGDAQTDTALIDISINDFPVVETNRELVVKRGETTIIENTFLETTDNSKTSLIYKVTELPSRGKLLFNGGTFTSFTQDDIDDGFLSYKHTQKNTKNDSFSFSVSDQVGAETTDTFNIRVNVAPNLTTNNLTAIERTEVEITNENLLAEDPDTDTDAATLIYELTEVPNAGILKLDNDTLELANTFTQKDINRGNLTYEGEEVGIDTFSYVVTDQDGGTTSGFLNIDVEAANTAPEAKDDEFETNEDTVKTIDKSELLANDEDLEGGELTIPEFADNTTNGRLEETADQFIYTPNQNFSGSESFTYTVEDNKGLTDTGKVIINIIPVADTPNLEISTPTVSGTDQEELPLDIAASLGDTSGSETLSITISGVPDGVSLSAGTEQGGGTWELTLEELDNLTILPPKGQETGTTLRFDLIVTATATETETANNNTNAQTGTISVEVEALNNAPVLTDSGDITLNTINENQFNNAGTRIAKIIDGAVTDDDGGASKGIAITEIDNSKGIWEYSVDDGDNWVEVSNSSTTLLTATDSDRLRFVPETDFFGKKSIKFRGWDTTDGSSNTTQLTEVLATGDTNAFSENIGSANILVNDIPEISRNKELVINFGETKIIAKNLLQTTDGDNGTNTFTYTITQEATAGILQLEDNPTQSFTQEDINSGLVIYEQKASNTKDDSFSFRVIDVDGGRVKDTFNIRVNDPPVGTTTDLNVTIGETKVIAQENLLFIDPDVEDAQPASLEYTLTELPSLGQLQQGEEILTIDSTFTQENLDNGEISYATTTESIGTDSLKFLVTDQDGGITNELLNINVIQGNRAPRVEEDKLVTLEEDTTKTLDILEPIDPDGDLFTITVDSIPDPEIGQVVLNNNTNTALTIGQQLRTGELTSLTFIPVENANGNAGTFSYIVDDGNDENNSATQVISIDVTSINDPPIAVNDGVVSVFTSLDNSLTINIYANDSDGPEPLSIIGLSNDDDVLGISAIVEGSQVQYTSLETRGTGVDTLEYTVTDGIDQVTANAIVNVLNVTDEADSLPGGEFNDNFDGDQGDDTLEGLGGNDTLTGNDDNDSLVGGEGDDSIDGGEGDDTLFGGLGADILSDDNGDNTFVYTRADDGSEAKFNAANATSISTAIDNGLFDRITGFDGLGEIGGDTLAFSSEIISSLDNIATNVQTTDISENVLNSGTPGLFAYEVEDKTYLIYDANGDNTVGDDSQILAELEDVSGITVVDVNDDFTII